MIIPSLQYEIEIHKNRNKELQEHCDTLERKVEHLLNKEIYPVLQKFPKAEKFSLCQEIKQAFYGLLKSIMLANNIRTKRRFYQEDI